MFKPIIAARVNHAELKAATRTAHSITADSDHRAQAQAIVDRLRLHQPETVSQLIRVICGLPPAPVAAQSLADGDEARITRIYAKVSEAERVIVSRFLVDYARARKLSARIEARLRRLASWIEAHKEQRASRSRSLPAQLVRAVIGLEPSGVGAPTGNQNAARPAQKRARRKNATNQGKN